MEKIRVMIAEDESIVRRGFKLLVNAEEDMEVVAEAVNGKEAVEYACTANPDVILMDLIMPQKGGLEAMEEIHGLNPAKRVVVMTGYSDAEQVLAAVRRGAAGYLLKHCPPEELFQAIRYVHQGEMFLHPTAVSRLLQGLEQPKNEPPVHTLLTNRETDVLKMVARGFSNKEIGDALSIHPMTVKGHVKNILTKLKVNNRTQAALYALQNQIAHLDEIKS